MTVSRTHLRRRAAITTLAVAALALAGATPPAKPAAPRWSATVSTSDIGAFVVGKPDAKVRLIEYFSYTCSHCADFTRLSAVPLKSLYIDKGLVVFEYRNLVRDPVDMTAALLARCGGGKAFAGNHQAIFGAQKTWLGKVQKAPKATITTWYQGGLGERAKKIAAYTGLGALMRARGYTAAQLDTCMDDGVAQAELEGMTNLAFNADGVRGTPTFFINGREAGVTQWPALKTPLDAAIKAP
jgi:protein-disulfide isomerase